MTLVDANTIAAWANSPYVLGVLALLSFSESAFFIIPPEVLVIPMALAQPKLALWYGLFISFFSLLGAAFGYWLGKRGGRPILRKLFKEEKVKAVEKLFKKYDTKAMFISAFTPIPFKIFTIAGGVFSLDFKRFMAASALGRTTRYLIITGLIFFFGEAIDNFIRNQLDMVIGIGTAALILIIGLYKVAWPFIEKRLLKQSLKDKLAGLFSSK